MHSFYGVGTNRRQPQPAKSGGRITPVYECWRGMLRRCYDPATLVKGPSYAGVTVAPEFFEFQEFAAWALRQVGFGLSNYQMDKDLLLPERRQYAPDTVLFVPQALNAFLVDSEAIRGECPQGVAWHKRDQKFRVQMKQDSKVRSFGYYDTAEEAAGAYAKAKTAEGRRWGARLRAGEFLVDPRLILIMENYRFKDSYANLR